MIYLNGYTCRIQAWLVLFFPVRIWLMSKSAKYIHPLHSNCPGGHASRQIACQSPSPDTVSSKGFLPIITYLGIMPPKRSIHNDNFAAKWTLTDNLVRVGLTYHLIDSAMKFLPDKLLRPFSHGLRQISSSDPSHINCCSSISCLGTIYLKEVHSGKEFHRSCR